ncbi:MAG: EscU/YscU/HrcU family type III secretion system export apparatus switch protein [Verrucomicrobia bacterium]|nr:EscU/YscU/HrcU family type III secretion system export apparatus switch protein [Verrucomicrobiota bacterium]
MSEFQGEKTEQATPRKLEEALKRGQIPRSAEVQTVFALGAGVLALTFTGKEMWRQMALALTGTLGHLHELPVNETDLPGQFISAALLVAQCVWPVLAAVTLGSLLAGGMQSRFQTASEVLAINWERINPISGLKRFFSVGAAAPTAVASFKLLAVVAFSYGEVKSVLSDPIFSSAVSPSRLAEFLADAALRIMLRVGLSLTVIAAGDYAYQFWKMNRELMMTKQEVKDEAKSTEGNSEVKARQRRRRRAKTQRQMLLDVPKADVVVTNPTHLAVALRYDPKMMTAPKIVAKGSRLNALRIREIAQQHQVPILENKPLARMMFKYGRVGGEVPAQLYAAVAEVLAWVYRINRYRYYTEANRT